jgi:hypothetical protein
VCVHIHRSFNEDRSTAVRLRAVVRSRAYARPATTLARPALPRPPHPIPTFVTMANAPLSGRDGEIFKSDLGLSRSGFFLQRGLDKLSRAKVFLPVGQITNGQTLRHAVRKRQERTAFIVDSVERCLPCKRTQLTSYPDRRASGCRRKPGLCHLKPWPDFGKSIYYGTNPKRSRHKGERVMSQALESVAAEDV